MQLAYYRSHAGNFGDDLNCVIWPHLAPELFDEDRTTGFVGIGTLIGTPLPFDDLKVFSSGVGYDSLRNWDGKTVEYACVRGKVSCKILGLSDEFAIADGAILAPLLPGFAKSGQPGSSISILPHFQTIELGGWTEVAQLTGFELVDPRGDPQAVVAQISKSKLLITESLHGAIMADLYGIPWVAFATSKHFAIPKWIDWSSSIGRELEVASVPPPRPEVELKYGRAPFPFDEFRTFGLSDAPKLFEASVWTGRPPPFKSRLKSAVLKNSRVARSMLNLTPQRTAEALQNLVYRAVEPSSPTLYGILQDRLLEKLQSITRNYCGSSLRNRS